MNIAKPLYWHQGISFRSMHLQHFDRANQSLLVPYQKFMAPYFWGVWSMEIDAGALKTGSFNLLKGDFVFPDGTHTSLQGNALINARSFQEQWEKDGKPLNIFLGLKNWTDDGANVTVLPSLVNISSVSTRFAATNDPEEARDLHTGGADGWLKKLHFVLRIFWESERNERGDYQYIHLAQLQKFGQETRLSEDFIPPVLSFNSSHPLVKLVTEIRDQTAARSYQLEEHKSRRGVQTAEFGSRDMVYFLALRSINRYVPLLFHCTKAEFAHPWHIYGILRQLIGELTTFSEEISVLGVVKNREKDRTIRDYDHNDIWACFSAAQEMISHLLDQITAGPEYVIRLTSDGVYFAAELKPTIFEGRNRYYLAVRTDDDPKSVLKSLEDLAKLSSRDLMHMLVTQALPGINLEHLQVPPQELPRRAHTVYFRIDHHDEQWTSVVKARAIALYWHNAPEDVEIELMVVGK
ncbi:MAG: type VI secretion system baseplate subunit TssK [Geobacteraceae bacterium]|nr:type VI secretion system baseplate subunit TssK [Geobacteraceae bacterium]